MPLRHDEPHGRWQAWGAFLLPFCVSLVLHGALLGYPLPFGGQQSDDDYHYYSYAARFDADDPVDLPAYRLGVPPDRVTNLYDASRIEISFSNFLSYPGWTWLVHHLVSHLRCSYQIAALCLFVLQSGLVIFGVQTLASAMVSAPALGWRLTVGLVAAMFLGVEGVPSPLVSIPMNMAAALSLAALGMLVTGRRWLGVVLLGLAVTMHVASAVLVGYVLGAWTLCELLTMPRRTWPALLARSIGVALVVLGGWVALHVGWLGVGQAEFSGGLTWGFDKYRLDYLIRSTHWFFPIVSGAGVVACWLVARSGDRAWRLPAACLLALGLAGAAGVLIGNPYTTPPNFHPLLHPLGRLLYLGPMVLIVASSLAMMRVLVRSASGGARAAVAACALSTVMAAAWQGHRVLETQFASRYQAGLGPLYQRLSQFAGDRALPRTGFVFFDHNMGGTVLSAAHLYEGRYFWARVYSPERLRQATAPCDRLVYLEGPEDPPFQVAGFCVVSEETIALGLDPTRRGIPVRLVQAERC